MNAIKNGVDKFIEDASQNKSRRLAVVTNHATFDINNLPVAVALLKAGFNLIKIFSPEHGITSQAEDGKEQKAVIDFLTGLPVVSLYGENFAPQQKDMNDVDAILFDLPNIGARFYTYLWTLSYVLEACGLYQKKLIILDRPNLSGGNIGMAEGPVLDERNCSSFIGRWAIPIRYQLTYGEIASYWNSIRNINAPLEIVKVDNWNRNVNNNLQKSIFIPTSPSMPSLQTVFLYPGMCLLEGVNVNEGRGTAMPFQLAGAPWIKSLQLYNALKEMHLPGIQIVPYSYMPMWGRYEGSSCHGVYINILDEAVCRPVYIGLTLLHVLYHLYPEDISLAVYPTFANPTGENHLQKLCGILDIWEIIQLPKDKFQQKVKHLLDADLWQAGVTGFLLYN